MKGPTYKRVLVKLSGEVFATPTRPIDPKQLGLIVAELKRVRRLGVEVAVVVGGGNLWRKRGQGAGLDGRTADYLGLMATVMNALMLHVALQRAGQPCMVQSPLGADVPGIAKIDVRTARRSLRRGTVVVFAAGTGQPGFTTDTAAAQRAVQVQADLVVKVGPVDGVYTADPMVSKRAKKFTALTMREALRRKLKVMDKQAFQLCAKAGIPILVCRWRAGVLAKVVTGASVGTLVSPV